MLHVNDEVTVTSNIALEPYALLEKGERGTVVDVQADDIGVYETTLRMRRWHPGLAQWNNEALLAADELPNLKVIPRTVRWLKKFFAALVVTIALGSVADVAMAHWPAFTAACSTILDKGLAK